MQEPTDEMIAKQYPGMPAEQRKERLELEKKRVDLLRKHNEVYEAFVANFGSPLVQQKPPIQQNIENIKPAEPIVQQPLTTVQAIDEAKKEIARYDADLEKKEKEFVNLQEKLASFEGKSTNSKKVGLVGKLIQLEKGLDTLASNVQELNQKQNTSLLDKAKAVKQKAGDLFDKTFNSETYNKKQLAVLNERLDQRKQLVGNLDVNIARLKEDVAVKEKAAADQANMQRMIVHFAPKVKAVEAMIEFLGSEKNKDEVLKNNKNEKVSVNDLRNELIDAYDAYQEDIKKADTPAKTLEAIQKFKTSYNESVKAYTPHEKTEKGFANQFKHWVNKVCGKHVFKDVHHTHKSKEFKKDFHAKKPLIEDKDILSDLTIKK